MSLNETQPQKKLNRVYREHELAQFDGGISAVTRRDWIRAGEFPAPVKLGGEGGRMVGWLEDSLLEWQASRKVAL